MAIRRVVFALLLILLFVASQPEAGASNGVRGPTDFDGNGVADLAIGAPNEDFGSVPSIRYNVGVVHAIYGISIIGLTDYMNDYIHQDRSTVIGAAEQSDQFGAALAIGNFDGDRFFDLAVGVPGQGVEHDGVLRSGAGAVHIFYGAAILGLTDSGDQVIDQGSGEVSSIPETDDHFGQSLASGDFNGDGYADLAVGAPGEDYSVDNCGVVHVLYGSAEGLQYEELEDNYMWYQGRSIWGSRGIGDYFGTTLASGNFNGDSYDDLAIGVPYEDEDISPSPTKTDAGVVQILHGSADGLSTYNNQLWHQAYLTVAGEASVNDLFGFALGPGDFNGDNYDDLAIGVPGEDVGGDNSAGAVNIFFGGNAGLSDGIDQLINQDWLSIDNASAGDQFGFSLAAADFNRDGNDDLAVGVPFEDIGLDDIGTINVLPGRDGQFVTTGGVVWFQGVLKGLEDEPETGDQFGYSLAAGDFNRDGFGDLAVGVPYEDSDSPSATDAGAVSVMYGSSSGLSNGGDQFWYQGRSGIADEQENFDNFGLVLAAFPKSYMVFLPLTMK